MPDSSRGRFDERRRGPANAPADRAGGSGAGRDRTEAQRRVDRVRAFRAELDALRVAGVARLTPEQREEITQYHAALLRRLAAEHDIDRTDAAGQLSRGMRIASFIAAIALTAAVYSLVVRFWGRMDLPLQATLLCAFPLAALVSVELSARRERTLYIASIFGLVAFATYWLAVFVLSTLVNVPVTPLALWGGALFGVALALPYGCRLIFGSAMIAMLIALAGSVFQAAGIPWTHALESPEIITAEAFVMLVIASHVTRTSPLFEPVARAVAASVGFLGLLFLSLAGPASLFPLPSRTSELLYQAVLLVSATAVLLVGIRKQWIETVYVAAAAITLFIVTRFFDWFWDAMPRFVFFLLLAALAFGWLFALRRLRSRLEGEPA